jgi:hypothetical protein
MLDAHQGTVFPTSFGTRYFSTAATGQGRFTAGSVLIFLQFSTRMTADILDESPLQRLEDSLEEVLVTLNRDTASINAEMEKNVATLDEIRKQARLDAEAWQRWHQDMEQMLQEQLHSQLQTLQTMQTMQAMQSMIMRLVA